MNPGTVTVFGGSGLIGRYVVRLLAREGWVIRIAVRHADEALFLKTAGEVGQIVPLSCDVTSPAQIRTALDGAEAAINLVGVLCSQGRQTFQKIHADVPETIGKAAKEAGLRSLIHLSAFGADENAASHYGRRKAEGETRLRAAFPDATILRPSIVFGPEDDFFNRFARLARIAPFLPLIGGGKTLLQPVYVGDVAQAIQRTLNEPAYRGDIFELGGPTIYSLRELLAMTLREAELHRWLLPVPFSLAGILGRCLSLLPRPPLTHDQVQSLRQDNVTTPETKGLQSLGITPTPVEAILPLYLTSKQRERDTTK